MKIIIKRKTFNKVKECLGWLLFWILGAMPFLMILNELGR